MNEEIPKRIAEALESIADGIERCADALEHIEEHMTDMKGETTRGHCYLRVIDIDR